MENQSKCIVLIPKDMRLLADRALANEEKIDKRKRKHSEDNFEIAEYGKKVKIVTIVLSAVTAQMQC